jgi:outer membrane protein assembly factor BamB/mono/diheme cytochrome c family protein
MKPTDIKLVAALCMVVSLFCRSADAADDKPVSFTRDVQPIFAKSCVACHKPEKRKGKLDLTTYAGVMAGGDTGVLVVPGEPKNSELYIQVIPQDGMAPLMPEKGEPLTPAQTAIIRKWIEQGAKNDAADPKQKAEGFLEPGPPTPTEAVIYRRPPVVQAMALSPDGSGLAVAGRGEVLLLDVSTGQTLRRFRMASPRVTSLQFTSDGGRLVAAGGAAGESGQLVGWDVATGTLRHNWRTSGDTLFGLSLSPDATLAAFGSADRSAVVVDLESGKERLRSVVHTDWVLATAFSRDGSAVITTGRDKAVKRIELADGKATDINEPQDSHLCLAQSPSADVVVVGGATGEPRMFKSAALVMRTEKEKDPNRLKICEKVPQAVHTVAWSRDGSAFAAAGHGEVRIYNKDGGRTGTVGAIGGPVYALAFSADGKSIFAAGHDGRIRCFDCKTGKLMSDYLPEPFGK